MPLVLKDVNKNVLKGIGGVLKYAPPSAPEWANSLTLTISSGAIDDFLTDFPLMVHLGTQSGITSADTTGIFTNLGAASGKFTIQNNAGVDLPIEIESWDSSGQEAYLWVKVPVVNSLADTVLTLYYDSTHADMSNVYDTASQGASAVWDSNYIGVWHLSEDGASSTRYDSTYVNSNNAVPTNLDAGDSVTGKINGAVDLDGVNEYLTVTDNSSWDFGTNSFAVEGWFKVQPGWSHANYSAIVETNWAPGAIISLKLDNTGALGATELVFWVGSAAGAIAQIETTQTGLDDGQWHHVVGVRNASTDRLQIYLDGQFSDEIEDLSGALNTTVNIGIGTGYGTTGKRDVYWKGILDEVRVANTLKSAALIKADYHSGNDSLVTYS